MLMTTLKFEMANILILILVCINESFASMNNANGNIGELREAPDIETESHSLKTHNQHRVHRVQKVIDKDHYNKVYGTQLDGTAHRRHADIDYLKPGGSPWPWYEQAKVQYGDDKLLHKEQKREHNDHLAEYKKQFGENTRIYQETQRVNLETDREGKMIDAQHNAQQLQQDKGGVNGKKNGARRRRRKRKDEIFYKSRKDSKQFLV